MPTEPDRRPPPRSAAWRGALWITLIALIATAAALTVQYGWTLRLLDGRLTARIDEEAAALVERHRAQGPIGVAASIARQQRLPRAAPYLYLLADGQGRALAGNLPGWPAGIDRPGLHDFTIDVIGIGGEARRETVRARAVALAPGLRLLVGSFADERALLRARYAETLFWALLATGGLGLLLGWFYSRRGLAFVAAVSDAGDRFLAGRLDERLPVSTRGDEYDRLAATINRCFDEVERLIASLRAATDGLAHDLKTPLTRLRARLELAELRAGGEAGLAADLRAEIDALLTLVEDTLAISRAEAQAAGGFTAVALDAIVGDAVELFEPVAAEAGVALDAAIAPARVTGAAALLARLIANLIDNAIKYTPRGGHVRVGLANEGGVTVLRVADDGPGIPEAERDRVLARFYRMDRSRATPGSGLGLSIAAAVARVHGATLTLGDAEPGLIVTVRFGA